MTREGELTFASFVEGVDLNTRSQTFEWQEELISRISDSRTEPDTEGSVLRGQLTVYLGAFILADIALTFRVDITALPPRRRTIRRDTVLATSSASPTPPQPELTPATSVPYQRVYRPTATKTWLS